MPGITHPMDIMNTETRLLQRIKALEDRIAALERGAPLPITGSTPAPTAVRTRSAVILAPGSDPTTQPPQLLVKVGDDLYATNLGTPATR